MSETRIFCLVCGKWDDEHDPEERVDCGETWRRCLPALRGEGYEEAAR